MRRPSCRLRREAPHLSVCERCGTGWCGHCEEWFGLWASAPRFDEGSLTMVAAMGVAALEEMLAVEAALSVPWTEPLMGELLAMSAVGGPE